MSWPQVIAAVIGAIASANDKSGNSSTTVRPWGPTRDPLRNMLDEAQFLWESADKDGYQGDLHAGLTAPQLQGIDMATLLAGMTQPGVQGAFDLGERMLAGDFLHPESNPYLQGNIDAMSSQVMTNLTNNILPAIAGGAVASGGYGGSRQGVAEGLASGGAATAIGDLTAGMLSQNYAMERANQMATPQFLLQALGLGASGADLLMGAGNVLQQDNQAQLDAGLQRWQMDQAAPWQAMAPYWEMALGASGIGGNQSVSQPGSPLTGAIGGGLLGWQWDQANKESNSGTTPTSTTTAPSTGY